MLHPRPRSSTDDDREEREELPVAATASKSEHSASPRSMPRWWWPRRRTPATASLAARGKQRGQGHCTVVAARSRDKGEVRRMDQQVISQSTELTLWGTYCVKPQVACFVHFLLLFCFLFCFSVVVLFLARAPFHLHEFIWLCPLNCKCSCRKKTKIYRWVRACCFCLRQADKRYRQRIQPIWVHYSNAFL